MTIAVDLGRKATIQTKLYRKVVKTQENVKHKIARRSALSQQVITLQNQAQTLNINNKKEWGHLTLGRVSPGVKCPHYNISLLNTLIIELDPFIETLHKSYPI